MVSRESSTRTTIPLAKLAALLQLPIVRRYKPAVRNGRWLTRFAGDPECRKTAVKSSLSVGTKGFLGGTLRSAVSIPISEMRVSESFADALTCYTPISIRYLGVSPKIPSGDPNRGTLLIKIRCFNEALTPVPVTVDPRQQQCDCG